MELHDGNGASLASNHNWTTDQQIETEATQIAPTSDVESAVVADLSPSLYTSVIADKSATGIGLIEICYLP